MWLDADSGTVVSTLSQVEETYCEGFVAYLARFLLNYDDDCKAYFRHKMDVAVKKADGRERWEEFRVRIYFAAGGGANFKPLERGIV